ncbi:alkane 1-monooxygenase [Bdellovibrio bacteriovorus]|uniref:Alkane 1-monooxygenase n=1 Tax=Bdellovibrio bacteriovorus (strain ATCC 15356 / DSM 50701 / NCIMB 9529 / HD100) TaxID=264462 RepID=Q6ML25_BDEBA|nr:alkane 1-monooxygenase [Bdellovibrio bacteriovorus]CAE80032.1 alkane 1-monooxygenase [Bdellovibrio bacteriovorus HD100]
MKAFLFYSRYSLAYLFALLALLGAALGGAWTFLGVIGLFVIHPIWDHILRTKHIPEVRPKSRLPEALLIFALPFMSVFLFTGVIHSLDATALELTGLILSFGAITGVLAINTAHELAHRREKTMRGLGVGLLLLANFAHYAIEHVYGHHKNVATPEDPATARKNEWIYTYHFRSFFGGLWDAFKLENKRLNNKPLWHRVRHRIVWYLLLQVLMCLAVFGLYGNAALVFWLGQGVVGVLLLQTADYIEHYGLVRTKKEDGFYEGTKAPHSWDSYQAVTNYTLINLGYHSHHHLKATLPFTELQEQPGALKLPHGYSAMALLAFASPLYFKKMNPLISLHQK